MTLIEIMIALSILAISILALLSSLCAAAKLQDVTRERALAQNAARAKIEEMRSRTYTQIYSLYNSNPADDPGGPGTAPGATFTVPGLNAFPGVPVGQIVFPESGGGLLESLVDPSRGIDASMGMPRDLNGNGIIDVVPFTTGYQILPVKIVITWKSANGKKSRFEINELIASE
jgi:type II secretory pathway pseudopilin PulG